MYKIYNFQYIYIIILLLLDEVHRLALASNKPPRKKIRYTQLINYNRLQTKYQL